MGAGTRGTLVVHSGIFIYVYGDFQGLFVTSLLLLTRRIQIPSGPEAPTEIVCGEHPAIGITSSARPLFPACPVEIVLDVAPR